MKRFIILLTFAITLQAQTTIEKQLNVFIDNWHHAAATANEEVFFGSMDDESIYIGTDATERWSKQVFQEWCKFAFARESAWTFIPLERKFYITNDKYVWFDETLDTWMGICRGSGVVEYKNGYWKIKHYHLAVTVPNEFIKEFTDLVKQQPYKPVISFDATRAGDKDLAYAILEAKRLKKKILIEIGTPDSQYSQKFFDSLHKNVKIRSLIDKHYLLLRIDHNEKNAKLLKKYTANAKTPLWCILNDNAQKIAVSDFLHKSEQTQQALLFLKKTTE